MPFFEDGSPYVPSAITSDADGNVYVTGTTDAAKLPQVSGGVATSAGGNDAYVVKLDPNGALKATMIIGGSADDAGTSITLGPDGYLYVAGITQSTDFPTSANAYQAAVLGTTNFFALKIDPKLLVGDISPSQAILYSSVFGSVSYNLTSDYGTLQLVAVAVDAMGNAYLAAPSDCTGLGATPGAVQIGCAPPSYFAVIAKINPAGTKLLWAAIPAVRAGEVSSFAGFAVDAQGSAYLAGTTASLSSQIEPQHAFVAKLSPDGTTLAYNHSLGGNGSETVGGLAVDAAGNAYVTGSTSSSQFPTLNSMQSGFSNKFCYGYSEGTDQIASQFYCNPSAGFLSVINPDGSGLAWSTLLGYGNTNPLTLDAEGNVYLAGNGVNPGVPTANDSPGEIQLLKISPGGSPIPIDGVANSAGFHLGLPYPGGLATLFVHGLSLASTVTASELPLPLQLAGVSISVYGVPAPILAVANVGPLGAPGSQQINFQVPFGTPGNGNIAGIALTYQGATSYSVPTRVAPGIFTLPDGSGAIQHASDFSPVTPEHPAQTGETIIIYATGLGDVSPPVATGVAATGPAIVVPCYSPPTVSVGDVLYAGITPGFPGMYQLNVRISPNALPGDNNLFITWVDCWASIDGYPPEMPANDSTSNKVTLPLQ